MSPDNPGRSPADRVGGEQAQDTPFTPEEQKEFETMREATSGPPPEEKPAEGAEKAGSQPDKPGAEKPSKSEDKPDAGAQKAAAESQADDEDDDAEAAAEGQKPGADGAQPPKRVSYNKFRRTEEALKAEKKRSAERDTALAKANEDRARVDERLKIINEALTTPAVDPARAAAEEDPEPDMEKDLFGYVAWQKRQIDKANKSIAEMRQGQQVSTEEQNIARTYISDAQAFQAKEPAFVEAYNYLMATRVYELATLYFGKDLTDPETPPLTQPEINRIREAFAAEEKQLVAETLAKEGSPAQRIWTLAKQRGFRKKAAATAAANGQKPAATNGGAAPGNLAEAASAAEGAAKPDVAAEIALIKKGKDGSLSLSEGGGAPTSPLTAEKLANMSQAEFDRMVETLPKDKLRELMGG